MTGKKEQLYAQLMSHAIGMDQGKTFKKDGERIYRPYRNYYLTSKFDDEWDVLVSVGYAKRNVGRDTIEYSVTPDGIQWLAKQAKVNICLTY